MRIAFQQLRARQGSLALLAALLVVEREFPRAARAGTAAGVLLLALAAWKMAG
jgi:hypothetical protein